MEVVLTSNGKVDRVLRSKANDAPSKGQRGRHTPANKTWSAKFDEVCYFIESIPHCGSHYAGIRTQGNIWHLISKKKYYTWCISGKINLIMFQGHYSEGYRYKGGT